MVTKIPFDQRCTCPREGEAEPFPHEPNIAKPGDDHGNVINNDSEEKFNSIISKEKKSQSIFLLHGADHVKLCLLL